MECGKHEEFGHTALSSTGRGTGEGGGGGGVEVGVPTNFDKDCCCLFVEQNTPDSVQVCPGMTKRFHKKLENMMWFPPHY